MATEKYGECTGSRRLTLWTEVNLIIIIYHVAQALYSVIYVRGLIESSYLSD